MRGGWPPPQEPGGKFQSRPGDGARFKSRRPLQTELARPRSPPIVLAERIFTARALFFPDRVWSAGSSAERVFTTGVAVAQQKAHAVNAEEFLLVDPNGKARAGLGLDAQGEVGLVLTSRDGGKTLYLSPDEPVALGQERAGSLGRTPKPGASPGAAVTRAA
ncbi:MAG: hypothetical protein KatS3mg082_0421 [Nitrospiraceae bacterium]|nr:MAG: hypothetical protein KatS3mg082_0421 [Nitrospiraceae bacterium]